MGQPTLGNVRKAVLSDIQDIRRISLEFWEESNFSGLEPDLDDWDRLTADLIQSDVCAVFVYEDTAGIIGYLMMLKEKFYTRQPLANMFLFYVQESGRRSGAGRALFEASIEQAEEWEACAYYVGISAGISKNEKSLLNMYRRYGFEDAGSFQRRIL